MKNEKRSQQGDFQKKKVDEESLKKVAGGAFQSMPADPVADSGTVASPAPLGGPVPKTGSLSGGLISKKRKLP